jgi:hypothetical protein
MAPIFNFLSTAEPRVKKESNDEGVVRECCGV